MNPGPKFRVWDNLNKKYIKPVVIYFANDKVSWVDYVENEERKVLCLGEFVLEQYTGTKDKNGVEIYEGDIIKFEVSDKEYFRQVVNKHDYGCFMLTKKGETPYSFLEMYQMSVEEFEIIGNIHENDKTEVLEAK